MLVYQQHWVWHYTLRGYMQIEDVFLDPRNEWERNELQLIKKLHDHIYKDPRSIDAFCKLIFFYREEITRRRLLIADIEGAKCD